MEECCSCHVNPPCSYCVEGAYCFYCDSHLGSRRDDLEDGEEIRCLRCGATYLYNEELNTESDRGAAEK